MVKYKNYSEVMEAGVGLVPNFLGFWYFEISDLPFYEKVREDMRIVE